MRFSVLVPVYNAGAYLKECVESVLNQTCQDFELVLVDDGSTDDCGAICDEYHRQHPIRVRVQHQANAGLVAARRAGVELADGEYCMFLDADDTYAPNCLETVSACIDETEADIVIFNCVDRYGEKDTGAHVHPVFPDGTLFRGEGKRALYEHLISGWRLNSLCLKAIRTSLVAEDDTPYEAYFENPNTEDLLQTLYPITHADVVVYLDRPLYHYRRTAGSISSRALTGNVEKQFNEPVMAALRRYMEIWGMDTPEYLRAFHSRKINGMITVFWQHYHAARTDEERRMVIDHPWGSHLTDEDRLYVEHNCLGRKRRMQLDAILKRKAPTLQIIDRLGRIRTRGKRP